jgi:hypothetical protein
MISYWSILDSIVLNPNQTIHQSKKNPILVTNLTPLPTSQNPNFPHQTLEITFFYIASTLHNKKNSYPSIVSFKFQQWATKKPYPWCFYYRITTTKIQSFNLCH